MARRSVVIGDYIEGHSFVHTLDAKVKLISTFLFAIVFFSVSSIGSFSLSSILVLLLLLCSRLPIRAVLQSLSPVFIFLFVFSLIQLIVIQDGKPLFSIGPITIYDEGMTMAFIVFWRTIMLFLIAIIMTATTSSYHITQAIETLLSPLNKVRFPVRDVATMVSIALRFIPILRDELLLIQQAQRARGYGRFKKSLKNRIKLFIPLFVPLFIRALKRAEELGEAMEARGYQSRGTYTTWKKKQWQRNDTFALSLSIVLACLILWL